MSFLNFRKHTLGGNTEGGSIPALGSVLQADDFTYLGCFACQTGGVDLNNSRGGMTARRVSGQLHLLLHGDQTHNYPIWEMSVPTTLQPTYADAVAQDHSGSNRMQVITYWGLNPYGANSTDQQNAQKTIGGNLMDVQYGLVYLDGLLYWVLHDSYNTTNSNNRVFGAASLDTPNPDSPAGIAGLCTAYGPWRTDHGDKHHGAYLFQFPQDIADAYFDGRKLGMASTGISGVGGSPFGLNFYTLDVTNSTAVPQSDLSDEDDIAFYPTKAARYDIFTRQDISVFGVTREVCGWADPGNYSTTTATIHAGDTSIPVADTSLYFQSGSYVTDGIGPGQSGYTAYISSNGTPDCDQSFFYTARSTTSGPGNLTGIPASSTGSIVATYASGKRVLLGNYDNGRGGVIYEANPTWGPTSISNPANAATYQDYPGNLVFIRTADGKHALIFTGSLVDTLDESFGIDYPPDDIAHNWYGAGDHCPHGQAGEIAGFTTGPNNPSAPFYFMAYDIRDIADVQNGDLDLEDLSPINTWRLDAITDQIPIPSRGKYIMGMYWDDVDQKLYVCVRGQDSDSVFGDFRLPVIHVFGVA